MPGSTNGYSNLDYRYPGNPNLMIRHYVKFPIGVTLNGVKYPHNAIGYCYGGGGKVGSPTYLIGFPPPQFNAETGITEKSFKNHGSFAWTTLAGLKVQYGQQMGSGPSGPSGPTMPATP